jgi:uncharacterized membrane protein YgaE (UPF0421/DUF939 family)
MKNSDAKTLNQIQVYFEIAVIVGYALGMLGGITFFFSFVYYIVAIFLIPIVIANLVFAILTKNGTTAYTAVNIGMSFVTLIPFLGFFSAAAGIVMSSLAIPKANKAIKDLDEAITKKEKKIGKEEVVDVKATKKENKKESK